MKQFNLTQVSAIILIVILTAFVAQTSKAQYTKLHTFDAFGKGSNPYSYVTLSGNVLYGTTGFGGTNGNGILFKVNTDGSGFTKMVDFDGVNKGTNPFGSLTLSGNELFGMTAFGGTNGQGVIYKINNDGSGFIKLVDFGGAIDGAFPRGALTLVGTQLYGMTQGGGTTGNGIIFKINNDGTGFTKLLDFDGPNKGRAPIGSSLTLSGAVLYGMTNSGGLNNDGVVFKMNADGTGFTKLLDFDGVNKGAFPFTSSPTLSNNVLYSTTQVGGTNGKGVLFKMNTDGTGFTKLVDFDGTTKGSRPLGSVTVIGNTIYGMTSEGGVNNKGVMFKVNTDGSSFTKLVEFDDVNTGMRPYNTLIPSGNILFGMVSSEGSANNLGVVFKVNIDGSGFTKLITFGKPDNGSNPYGYVTVLGNMLYGTTGFGGTNGNGVLFKMNTDGSSFTKLVDFDGVNKGTNPFGSLTLSGNELFGMTAFGGTNGQGVIYKINTDGSGFIKLVDFGGAIDGAFPRGALTLVGTQLYGMTQGGGTTGNGIIFKINNDGTGFTKLLDFDGPNKGRAPIGSSLTLSGAVLYGMTNSGGLNDDGIVFKMNADGTGFTKLLDFDGVNKGAFPFTSSPTLSNNVLYSTTQVGGTNGKGVLFKMNTDGTGFTKLVDFDGTTKGSRPLGSVTVIGNTIYGMTSEGGVNNKGVMFKVNTNGSGFTKLVEFDDINTGMRPYNTLIPSGNILFGMVSSEGSTANLGTVFKYALPLTNQTITFNPIPPKTFGDADFDPGALTSSGLPVIYGSSDTTVATIVNNKVHIVAAGTATIVANQPGNGSFNPAPSQSQLITVNKAALVATADNKTKIFLDDNPPLTISYTGFVNGDTPASITEPTATTSAKFNSFVGTYPIILSGGFAANYLLTLVNGTLTIVDQPIIMPDNSASKAISNKKTMLTNDMINLSVADDTYAGLNIYPNPVNDELYIKNSIPITKIEIINMANQVLISKEFNSVTGVTINTSTLLRGMYTIKVFDITGKVSTNKIVKE